jgi:hypothetical protein
VKRIEVLKCDAETYDVKILSAAPEIFANKQVQFLYSEAEMLKKNWNQELIDFDRFLRSRGYQAEPTEYDLCYYLPVIQR